MLDLFVEIKINKYDPEQFNCAEHVLMSCTSLYIYFSCVWMAASNEL